VKIGDLISVLGVGLFILGGIYWVLYTTRRTVLARLHVESPVHLLGHLNMLGILLFVLGRVMARYE
jgi:hypothetical protein